MTVKRKFHTTPDRSSRFRVAGLSAYSAFIAAAFVMTAALAMAQESRAPNGGKADEPGFFESIGKWFERQADNIGSTFGDAGKRVSNFGHEAGIAARTTVEGAKDAADAVVKIPSARVISGHQKCAVAPNGAPDCVAAATAICKAKGFASGKSADMTTAEVCPAQVYLSGRDSGAGCHTETFVSRALCQ
jgi:hypothetical protein